MSFEKYATERLRSAEQQEIVDGESGFISDLVDVLTPERMNDDGIFIDFGGNKEAFVTTLQMLGIQDLLKRKTLLISDMSVDGGASTSHCAASLKEWAAEAPDILSTLEYMQALRWTSVKKDDWRHPIISESQTVTSRISAIHERQDESDGQRYIDSKKPMVVLEASYNYEPGVFNSDTYENLDLRGFIREWQKQQPGPNAFVLPERLSQHVADVFFDDETSMLLPSGRFSMTIGHPASAQDIFGVVKPVYPRHGYFVRNGRLREAVEPSDDE